MLVFLWVLFQSPTIGHAGLTRAESEVNASRGDLKKVARMENSADIYAISVKRILNSPPFTNANPPTFESEIVEVFRGSLKGSVRFLWAPQPIGTIDWPCDSRCRTDLQREWGEKKVDPPLVGTRYLVFVHRRAGALTVEDHCRFAATPENIKAIRALIKQD